MKEKQRQASKFSFEKLKMRLRKDLNNQIPQRRS